MRHRISPLVCVEIIGSMVRVGKSRQDALAITHRHPTRFPPTGLHHVSGGDIARSLSLAGSNALDAGANIAKVQEWLGHATISTTRVYDHRKTRPEDSPVFSLTRAPGGTFRPRGPRRARSPA